jgi:AraC family transcriptional regulator
VSLQIFERPALTVMGLQIQTAPMSAEIPALWPVFVARIDEIEHAAEPGVSYGVMNFEAGENPVLHYMAAISVNGAGRQPRGMTRLTIPAAKYASFRYPLSALTQGFCEIFEQLLPASGYAQIPGPYFERYNQAFDPANPASEVQICLPVRRRDR